MDTMATALWDLFENQRLKGLGAAMRQTLLKIEKSGHVDSRWYNVMGELSLQDGDFTSAARFFKQAMDETGKAEPGLNLGNALFYSGDIRGAKKAFQTFLDAFPNDPHGLVNLANCHLELGEMENAKSLCLKGLEKKVATAALWNCLGQIAYLEGDFTRAHEGFDRAYTASPDYTDALFNRANMAYRLGRNEEALRDFAQCLRKDENYGSALLNAAVIQMELGGWEQAKECLARALKINPRCTDAHYLRGFIHMQAKDYRQAREAFRESFKSNPNHAPTLLAQARLHLLESESGEGRAVLTRLLSLPVLDREEETAALSLLMELGEHQYCADHLLKIPEEHMDAGRRKVLVLSLWKCGKTKSAIQNLERLVAAEGESAGSLALLGRMLSQSGAQSLAEQRLRKALEMDPAYQAAAFELARIHLDQGLGQKALEVLLNLLPHCPEDPDCQYNLACCHARNGNFEESLKCLERALEYGFQDLDKIGGDSDLRGIRQFKEFAQLTGYSGN